MFTGFCFQNPARCPSYSAIWQSSGILLFFVYAAVIAVRSGRLMSLCSFNGSYLIPFFRIAKITRKILHAITMSDCIFFSGFISRVV